MVAKEYDSHACWVVFECVCFYETESSGIAFVLRSGKAVLCFILAHIHDNNALGFKTWNKCELTPIIKYIAIDILLNVLKRKQHFSIESTDDVGSLFCLPVLAINTGCTNRCIAMRTNGFRLKAAHVYINNGTALLHETIKLTLVSCSFDRTGFWVFQSLFFDWCQGALKH